MLTNFEVRVILKKEVELCVSVCACMSVLGEGGRGYLGYSPCSSVAVAPKLSPVMD